MTTQRDKVIVIGIHRWVVFIFCSLALLADLDISICDVFGEIGLVYWVWTPKIVALELKLLEKWRQ
jgi:hypothetical protein